LVSNFDQVGVVWNLACRGRVAELVGVGERLHGCRRRSIGGGVAGFELDGWDVVECGVQPLVVEPGDVVDDCEFELRPGLPDAVGGRRSVLS
jgi:hypothetical protein